MALVPWSSTCPTAGVAHTCSALTTGAFGCDVKRDNFTLNREKIRRAFTEAESWIEKLSNYRGERFKAIRAD